MSAVEPRALGVETALLCATVGPMAAAVIADRCADEIERCAGRFELIGTPQAVVAAKQLRRALAEMRAAARLRNLVQAAAGSGEVFTEVPKRGVAGRLSSPPDAGDLPVGEVAARLEVSEVRVRRLIKDRVLVATRRSTRGHPWAIDPESLAKYQEHRSSR